MSPSPKTPGTGLDELGIVELDVVELGVIAATLVVVVVTVTVWADDVVGNWVKSTRNATHERERELVGRSLSKKDE